MTSHKQYDRPGTQRTEHSSHGTTLAQRQRLAGKRAEQASHHAATTRCSPSPWPNAPVGSDAEESNTLSWQMWRMHDEIEASAVSLDNALRQTLLCLGGILCRLAGITIYALAHVR